MSKERKNQKMSNAFSLMVTILSTTKDAPSIKTYKKELSHPYDPNRTKNTRKSYRTHKSNQASPMLLLLNLN
jgi:hypothetical protein